MIINYLSRIPIQALFIMLLFFSCKEDADHQSIDQYVGNYKGVAMFEQDGLTIDYKNDAFIQLEKGVNNNELRIVSSSLGIVQDKVMFSGNEVTLLKMNILSNNTYEEGKGEFEGNIFRFIYVRTSQNVSERELKIYCNFTKQ